MIALVTSQPRFYQRAVRELEERGVKFLSLSPSEPIPPEVDLVVTSEAEKDLISFPRIAAASSPIDAVLEAIRLQRGLKQHYTSISIGIDPGKSIGLVALGEGRVVYEAVLSSPDDVVEAVREVVRLFSPERLWIRVGAAGGSYRNRIVARLQQSFNYPMEIVDEELTTGPKAESKKMGVHRDLLAARRIAKKKGKLLRTAIEVNVTSGEIKNLQRESRRRSEHITISKSLAEAVARGELELDEAIEIQRKKTG